jgi:hypothetical protein
MQIGLNTLREVFCRCPALLAEPGMDALVFGSWTAAWSSVAAVFDANATLLVKELAKENKR